MGVHLSELSKEKASELGLADSIGGALVSTIIPSGSAEVMEIMEQDVILSIDARKVENPKGLYKILQKYRGGDEVSIKVWRAGKEVELTGILLAKAMEDPGLGNILYDEVAFQGGYLRTITNSKADIDGPMPGLLFIPGFPCTSIDNLSPWHPFKKLVSTLSEKGVVVMRMEKSGVGDCMDTPDCQDISFEMEKDAYKAGLKKLRSYDFVDTNNIFILGHDLGGLLAPILATDSALDVKGVMVYGTILESFLEHLNDLARYQHPMMGGDYLKASAVQKELLGLSFELLQKKRSPKELAGEKEAYKMLLEKSFDWDGGDHLLGRHYTFWQHVQDLNLTQAWANCDAYVLALAGEADARILNPDQHKEIVKIVNNYHPGKASFMMVPKTNHVFIRVGTMKEGVEASKDPDKMFGLYQSSFNFTLVDKMADWVLEKAEK